MVLLSVHQSQSRYCIQHLFNMHTHYSQRFPTSLAANRKKKCTSNWCGGGLHAALQGTSAMSHVLSPRAWTNKYSTVIPAENCLKEFVIEMRRRRNINGYQQGPINLEPSFSSIGYTWLQGWEVRVWFQPLNEHARVLRLWPRCVRTRFHGCVRQA
jgi:hypothetical protein